MTRVLDASVAVKLVVEEPGTPEAVELLRSSAERIAPDWLLIETSAALWNKVKYSQLLEVHAAECLSGIRAFFDELAPSVPLLDSAFGLAFRLRHPVYDCLYLALALERSAKLVTADQLFAKAARRAGLGDSIELLAY